MADLMGRRLIRRAIVRWAPAAVAAAIVAVASAVPALAGEVTGAGDNLRTGWYPDEPALGPSVVEGGGFEKVFTDKLAGQIYAQPLTADGTLLVVTEEDWAYGIDPVTGKVRWEEQLGTAVEAGAGKTIPCTDLEPRVGITGTPVIDAERGVAYLVSNRYVSGGSGAIAWYMHAIKLDDGAELAGFPVEIHGKAQNLAGVEFEARQQLQRPALLMTGGVVYAAFGSHCDSAPYQGWIVGVSTSEHVVKTMWATSASGGSIWQSGGGLVSDRPGQIVFTSGNGGGAAGSGDPPPGPGDRPPEGRLGESVVRAQADEGRLVPIDFFSPFDNQLLDERDLDLGSAAPVALPSPYFGTESTPDLLLQEGKTGTVYLLNRDDLGGMGQGAAGGNDDIQELGPYGGVWGTASVWPGGGLVYIPSMSEPGSTEEGRGRLRFFKYESHAGTPRLSLAATTPDPLWFGSGSPIVTSSGTGGGTGVLWINWCPTSGCHESQLRAYDAVPAGPEPKPIWTAATGFASKFARPDASGGHLYVGNREGQLLAFSAPSLAASPAALELGTAAPGSRLEGEVTLTDTGTPLTVSAVRPPPAPFAASGLPSVGAKLAPGESITVTVSFSSASPGSFSGSFGLTTEAGEATIQLAASAAIPPPPPPPPAPAPVPGVSTSAGPLGGVLSSTVASSAVGALTAGQATGNEAPAALTRLRVRAAASRLRGSRRRLALAYTLSAAGIVEIAIYRRLVRHSCGRGVPACLRWVRTRLRVDVRARMGPNVLTLGLGRLGAAGTYRLDATPVTASGARGRTRRVEFETVR